MFFFRDAGDGEGRCRVRHIERELRTAVVRFAGFGRGFGTVVAVVDRIDLDLAAEHFPAEIFDRHFRRLDRPAPGERGVDARHIGDDGDLDRTVAGARAGGGDRGKSEGEHDGERRRKTHVFHGIPFAVRPPFVSAP